MVFENFILCYQQAPAELQLKIRKLWEQQLELGPFHIAVQKEPITLTNDLFPFNFS